MKKLKWIKNVPLFILIVGACAIMILATATNVLTSNATDTQEDPVQLTIKDEYVIGETFYMPQAPLLIDGGKQYQSTAFLRDPNGKGYTQAEIVLDTAGIYTVEYKAITENGKLLKETQTFRCLSSLYSVNGKNATAKYGKFDKYPDAKEGVAISLTPSSEFVVNKVIDLSTMHNSYESNVEFVPLLSFYVAPQTLFADDARQLHITLTDVHDANNKVTIDIKRVEEVDPTAEYQYENVYITAYAPNQMKIGLEKREKGEFTWVDGNNYIVHEGTQYGSSAIFSMSGGLESKGSFVEKQLLSIGWDFVENRVYSQSEKDGKIVKSIISDLDDDAIYDNLFNGFTTGEVYMSITASSFASASCQIVVTDIAGIEKDLLTKNSFQDVTAPQITIKTLDYEMPPKAIVGKPYRVFTATSFDDYDKNIITNVSVYRGYTAVLPIKMSLIDGCFTPIEEGTYTIVYVAEDNAGNVTKKTLEVQAQSDIQQVQISLSQTTNSGTVGKEFVVASASITHGTGAHTLTVIAKHKTNADISYEINQSTWSFRPLYAGEYDIVYRYGDYVETKETSYTVSIEKGTTPYIPKDVILPEYALKNSFMQLPEQIGYVFDDGNAVQTQCEILVRQDYGDYVLLSSNVVKVTANETFTVVYRLPSKDSFYEVEYQIPVIDTGLGVADSLDLTKYFVGDCKADAQNDYVLFTANGQEKDFAEIKFIKSLLAEEFQILFSTDVNYSGFENIVITLTDSIDKDVSISFTVFANEVGKTMVQLNGIGNPYAIDVDFFTQTDEYIKFKYNNELKRVEFIEDELIVTVDKDLSGKQFNGFASHFVHLKIELNGIENSVKDKAGIRIIKINNQSISALKNDIYEPEITSRTIREERNIDDMQELLPTYSADVLDPYIYFEMKVFDPDREIVTAIDGTLLDNCDPFKTYTIKLEKYGTYSVEYYALDGSGQQTYYSYIIKVADKIAPVATLKKLVEKGKVGDTIKIATVEATDNLDTELNVTWFVKMPSGRVSSLYIDDVQYNSFTAKEKGIYTVYCYVTDTAGNYTMKSYTVTIS